MADTTTADPGQSLGAIAPQAPAGRWDKLTIINQALINTANRPVVTIDDGSSEWRVASSAFDQWLEIMMYRRTWTFASTISQPLQRMGDSMFPGYADVFAKPTDCMFLADVWRLDQAALILPSICGAPSDQYNTQPPPLDYQVINDQIHTTAGQGSGQSAASSAGDFSNADFSSDFVVSTIGTADPLAGVICKYVPFPSPSQPWSVGFVAALRLAIEAACFRGLNEDFSEGNRCAKEAEEALMEAAARSDAEQPRRVAFRSRLNERRRVGRYGNGFGY